MSFERFMAKVSTDHPNSCWPWTAYIDQDGYGRFRTVRGHERGAHQVAYELFIGPIPVGTQIDHLCHGQDDICDGGTSCPHRRCVNPGHLEAVTTAENSRRGVRARKTECINGHPFTESNTYRRPDGGGRGCRACNRLAVWRYKSRKRLQVMT